MPLDRRHLMSAGAGLGAAMPAALGPAFAQGPRPAEVATGLLAMAADLGVAPDSGHDQTKALQAAIDKAAERSVGLALGPGRYLAQGLKLRAGSRIVGAPGRSILAQAGPGPVVTGEAQSHCRLETITIEGAASVGGHALEGLITLTRSSDLVLSGLEVRGSRSNGIVLRGCQGSVRDCNISGAALAALFATDSDGLEIAHNRITDCANNGILIWREKIGEDGTIVANNRIARIRAAAGGSGENGNGINVFRAGSVLVTGNRITDCAYTAIRGNAASNIQMVANSCQRLGEVGLYAEFGFEGALIASNLVESAATGISVTNFNVGGRLAVVQGNLVRNLARREHEPIDKRGDGICVEADSVVTGNTIENAPNAAILIGWGQHMREVLATSNIIRQARVGVMITRDPAAGAALIAQNMISGVREGAVRATVKGVLVGPDLTKAGLPAGRVTVTGNHVVGA